MIWPEPIRDAFPSDEAHAEAWMAWADRTPGGWRARMADRLAESGLELPLDPERPPVRIEITGPSDDESSSEMLVRYVEATSPCCSATVIVDPLMDVGRRGLCATCGVVLDHAGACWQPIS
jgi:hypothetical protein